MTTRAGPRALLSHAVAGIACALVACTPVAKEPAQATPETPVNVTVAPVFAGPIAASFELTGTVRPLKEAEVSPAVDGRVAKALVKEGDAVKAGQILFLLDRTSLPAEAGAAARRASRRNAEIRSPLAGVVLARFSSPGDRVTATPPTPMALVGDIDLMKLTALLPEARLAEVRAGQEATVTTDVLPGRGFGATVAMVSPAGDEAAPSPRAEMLVDNRDHALRPGAFARARVFTAHRPRTVLVPPAAVIDGRVTVAEDGVARVRPVQTGISTEEAVELLDGAAPGDLVVVSGNKGLRDGARITYRTP